MNDIICGFARPSSTEDLYTIIKELLTVHYQDGMPEIPGYVPMMDGVLEFAQILINAIFMANSTDPDTVWDVALEIIRRDDDQNTPKSASTEPRYRMGF